MKRENEALERYKSLHENRVRLAQKEINKINEAAAARDNFIHNYHVIKDMKARKELQHSKLMEAARNDALATVMKAIYITAMEAECMMDENIILAENMVDKWIDEQGGASKILSKNGNSTYLLSRISQIVEDAAIETVKEIEKDETGEEKDVPDENASKNVQIAQLTAKEAEIKAQIANLKAEKKAEDEEKSDNTEEIDTDSKEEKIEDSEAVPDTDDKADGVESTKDSDRKESTEPDTDDGDDTNNNTVEIEDIDVSKEDEAKAKTEDEKTEEKSSEDSDSEEADNDTVVNAPAEENDEEESSDTEDPKDSDSKDADSSEEEKPEDSKGEEEETADQKETDSELKKDEEELTDDEVDPDEDASEDDDVKDIVGEPIDTEEVEDSDKEKDKDEIFTQLEDEEDVQKAIEIIRNRVADAEETFIKNNAEDKKKIDELLNKISTNVKTVEDLGDKDPKKAQVAQEAVRECKQKIDKIYNGQVSTIFEKMSRILTQNIVKNSALKERYVTEDGQLDVDLVMESAKVMYGFLETLNTLQIEKVNDKYIANILNEMVE